MNRQYFTFYLQKDHLCESPSSNPVVRKWQKWFLFPVWNTVVVSYLWFILSSSVQPAVARATASVWSLAARCMWRMKTMSTAISLCPTAPGHPLRATCLVIWTRARRHRSGGLESGDRWAESMVQNVVQSFLSFFVKMEHVWFQSLFPKNNFEILWKTAKVKI